MFHSVSRALIGGLLLPLLAFGAEDTAKPLAEVEQLREQRQFEQALERLEALAKDPETTDDVRKVLKLERAKVGAEAARDLRQPAAAAKYRERAVADCRLFLGEQPDHDRASECRELLAQLLSNAARQYVDQSGMAEDPKRAEQLSFRARVRFEEARRLFEQVQQECRDELTKMGAVIPPDQKELLARRNLLRNRYLQSFLLAAAAIEGTADTHADKKKRTATLTEAAESFVSIYQRYRTRLAGLYAHLYAGRCYCKAGDYKRAQGIFAEILEQPDEPAVFRELKKRALILQVDCLQQQGEVQRAIDQGEEALRGFGEAWPVLDRAELQLILARAHIAQLAPAKPTGDAPPDDAKRRETVLELLAGATAGTPATRDAARKLLSELGTSEAPNTFDTAYAAGLAALAKLSALETQRKQIEQQIADEENGEVLKRLQDEQEKVRKLGEQSRGVCRGQLEAALKQADDKTDRRKVNRVRYLLAYLAYREQQFEQASRYAQPLTQDDPRDAAAPNAAKIQLACLVQLYQKSDAEEKANWLPKLVEFAKYALKTWPDDTVARDALRTLIPLMQGSDRPEEAETYRKRLRELESG